MTQNFGANRPLNLNSTGRCKWNFTRKSRGTFSCYRFSYQGFPKHMNFPQLALLLPGDIPFLLVLRKVCKFFFFFEILFLEKTQEKSLHHRNPAFLQPQPVINPETFPLLCEVHILWKITIPTNLGFFPSLMICGK